MRRRSKRYRADAGKVDRAKSYSVEEAIAVVKQFGALKFDASVELALRLNIDPKKSEQTVRGSLSLPKGIGKKRKVAVFADGEEARIAQDLGAVAVGMEDLGQKVEGGWMDFDVAIAVPRAMKIVGKLGKVLGPQGKMPTPKNGTVTDDIKTAVMEFMAGKIEFRNDAAGNLQAIVGKVSFPPADLKENVESFLEHVRTMRPQTVKGPFVLGASLSATMSPPVPIALAAH